MPHTDLNVRDTDYQEKIAETRARVLTQADRFIEEHPSSGSRWTALAIPNQLLDTRSKAKRDEILGLIRIRKMAMPPSTVVC